MKKLKKYYCKESTVKSIDEWFEEYSDSHQNQTNKKIHWVCVPAILFSIIGILAHFSTLLTALLLVLTLVFYARLDIVLAVAMAALLAVMAWLIIILPVGVGFYIGIFVIAWIGQFYGHKIEGKKPSFFKDLQFLLIGPVWCMDAYLAKVLPKWKSRQKLAITS
nr:Mpo1-like protein [Acinetobacter haemolyticus]